VVLAAYSNDVLKLGFRAVGLESTSTLYEDIQRGVTAYIPGNMPWSHGLFISVVWSVLAASLAYLFYRDRKTAGIIGLVVISHWLLDFIVHPPELPLLFNESRLVGLGLWTSHTGLIISGILEIVMLAVGLTMYLIHLKRRSVQLIEMNETNF
jgi:membrane-bound metal-dependent hydrolase YbcI (DUF457 family)